MRIGASHLRLNCAAILGMLLATLASGSIPAASAHESVATITLSPGSAVITGCNELRFEIWINDVSALYGIDLVLTYDPASISVVDQDPSLDGVQMLPLGSFLAPGYIAKNKACNVASDTDPDCPTAGRLRYAATQTNPTPPAYGSGSVLAFTLRAVNGGDSSVAFASVELSDRNGETIAASGRDGTVRAVAAAGPLLSIVYLDPTTARLSWSALVNADAHALFRDTAPYFDPAGAAYETTAALTFDDIGAVGNPNENHFYVVKAGCSSGFQSNGSNRVGEFDFTLAPGAAPAAP